MSPNINDLIQPSGNPNQVGPPPAGGMPIGAPPPGMGGMAPNPATAGPASPPPAGPAAPGTPAAPGAGQELATPAQMSEIKRLFASVQNANSKLVSGSLIDRNKMSVMRKDLMVKLFDIMKQAGVDPANPESVKSFLEQLDQQDPDLLAIFETAFGSLMGQQQPPQGDPQQQPDQPGQPQDNALPGAMPPSPDPSQQPQQPPMGGSGGPTLMDRFSHLNRMGGY